MDEVGDLPIETQGKLVRFLQDETCRRIGDTGSYSSDIRLIASTSRNLEQEKNANRFRSDLYYRLNVVPVPMPALRDRTEDIPLLVEKIIQNLARTHGYIPRQFSSAAMMLLQAYEWPGNIRQLRNILEWVMIMKGPGAPTDQEIQIDDLPPEITGQGNNTGASGIDSGYARFLGLPLREAREKFEREYLQAQVERFHGNVSKTAQFVEMERSALHRKLKTLEIYANDRDNSAASTQEEENPPARTAISG